MRKLKMLSCRCKAADSVYHIYPKNEQRENIFRVDEPFKNSDSKKEKKCLEWKKNVIRPQCGSVAHKYE